MPAYLFLAGGAVGVAAAVTFGIMSRQAGQDAADQCVDDLCEASAQQDLDREKTYAIVADVSGIVGLASAGVGAYLLWKLRGEPTETRRALHIVPTALPGGAGIGVVSDF